MTDEATAPSARTGGATRFGARLRSAMGERSPLCVGIDPHAATLRAWGLPRNEAGLTAFGAVLVDAAVGRAAAVKPQVAFFEVAGAAGYRALEATVRRARDAGLLVIADAKRGDIGSTGDDYAAAWLDPSSPLASDALTVSPYLGFGALAGTLDVAAAAGAGVFVLAATSNPEGRVLQTAVVQEGPRSGSSVAAGIVLDVADENRRRAGEHTGGPGELGSVGLVIGATLDLADFGLRTDAVGSAPVLAPGFGAQGARIEDLRARFGAVADQVLVNESRGLLASGPDGVQDEVAARVDRIAAALA
ncbi:orotidine-5'-phosphate decarboxylase [Curtobacterium sp. MCBD17_040]|uniref:orotidine-5'-phosphate decarboxylase n=1 Tax=Curtobacterium sp. MCBD17_040 TaxID=2175674 RepID=UPI0021ACAB31|nr:orotidine-5'-phosphate decarboxylase [Curtobacterium sp. MCBD17_040]WIB62301.1 orotidine-5'-phosphate decarboxylase [Curtobacterium sp. MCBD17_040]